jgi:hypothetical protein
MKKLTDETLYKTPHDYRSFDWDDLINHMIHSTNIPVGNYSFTCLLQKSRTRDGLGKISIACVQVREVKDQQQDPNQQELSL